jgi:hypothetical protein
MKKFFSLTIVFLFTFSFMTFAQLDSVYHQGPSQGSQPNGAIQNTDNFPVNMPVIPGGEIRVIPNMIEIHSEPMLMPVDESKLPEYVYIEDANAVPNENPNLSVGDGSVLLNSFQGFTMNNYIPPDPTMAVGPNHIIACVNGDYFRIFDKQGNIVKTISAGAWFAPVSPETGGDPQIIYDHFAGRWVMLWLQANSGNLTSSNLLAYSDDDDPIGTWYVYRLDTKKHGTVQSNTWGDFPQLGFDDEAIYITTQVFGFAGGFSGTKLRVIRKSELYGSNGGPVTWWDFWDIRRPNANPPAGTQLYHIHPTFSYTAGQGGYLFFANNGGGNYYVIYKVLNPTANPPRLRGKDIPVQFYYGTPNAGQLGGSTAISSNGSGVETSPIIRDGKLYVAHSVGNSTSPSYASAKYLILDLNTVTIEEQAELGAVGYFYIFPTLAVDESNNIGMTFTRSATTEYAGAFYSTKKAGDPPGLNPSEPIQVGLGNYVHLDGGNPNRNRWGDYMAIYLDPADNHGIFMHTEYANTGNSWATYIGHIIAAPYPGAHAYLQPGSINFKDVETGTTSVSASIVLANFGDADLIISDIPSSFGDFNLETTLSFPLTLTTYDSLALEFSYSPTAEGPATVIYPVTSNDAQFSGINLSGNGYNIVLASEKTFYASSGSQNSGNILTIDPVSGAGTIVGASLFTEVTSISINPLDGKIYGLVAGSGSSDLLKVNAEEGDSYIMFTLNISLMAGIAFDTTGVLYGVTRSGELYTIDITNGTTNLVVDAQGTYLGITFNPVTNELWATSRAVILPNKDAIFKVNLSTGDTTIVGHTGLNKQTNCLAFDENLNLYGVIGTSSELNDFISINTATGGGTIIGTIGMNHILGLTYIDKIISNIEDDKNSGSVPSDYALRQNYPNPFNPTTRIDFALPVESNVKIIVYNMLGQEVITLVNEQKSAGNHTILWNATDAGGNQLTSGIYFYKLIAEGVNGNEFQDIKKMILLK